jgi:hypothetical protein
MKPHSERWLRNQAATANRMRNKATKSLSLATTYLEDGAPLEAARCCAEAAVALFALSQARRTYFGDKK